jgi:D-sedoheptulose 7-phosphate isomerase
MTDEGFQQESCQGLACPVDVLKSFPLTTHSQSYLRQVQEIAAALDHDLMEKMAASLAELRERGGRLFLLGVGGSAANCSHAVNDFRKLAA